MQVPCNSDCDVHSSVSVCGSAHDFGCVVDGSVAMAAL